MGGQNADLTLEQSVRGVIDNVLRKMTIEDTGKFFKGMEKFTPGSH